MLNFLKFLLTRKKEYEELRDIVKNIKVEKIIEINEKITILENDLKNLQRKVENLNRRVFADEMAERRAIAKENENAVVNTLLQQFSNKDLDINQIISNIVQNPQIMSEIIKNIFKYR